MYKRRNTKNFILISLIVAITCLSIGFAAISTVLDINGTGNVESSSFDVRFEDLSMSSKTSTTTIVEAPTIKNGTEISDFDVTFAQPGDYVSYDFYIVNEGTYDAEAEIVNVPTPTCTGTGTNATTDAKNVCDYLTYELMGVVGAKTELYSAGEYLNSGEMPRHVRLTLTYDKNKQVTADKLPKSAVNISNLDIQIKYVQYQF